MVKEPGIRTTWEENSPDSLVNQSIHCILHNPETIFYAIDVTRLRRRHKTTSTTKVTRKRSLKVVEHEDQISDKRPRLCVRETHSVHSEQHGEKPSIHLRLHPYIHLPAEIYEKLLATMYDVGFDLNDSVLTAFGDPSTSRLRRVHLRHSSTVTDFGLTALLKVSEPLFLG